MDHRRQSGEQAAGLCRWYFCGALSWPKQLRPDQLRSGICDILCLAMYAWHQQCDRQELCGSSGAAGRNNWNDPVAAGDFKSAVCIGNHRYCQCRGQRRTSHRCGCSAVQHWPHFQVFDTLNYWFQARLQSKYSAIAELVSYAAMSVYKIILLALGKSVEWFAVASALDYIVLAVFLLIAYFKNGGTRFRYSLKKQRSFCKAAAALS